jgi:hypothetical protein
VSVESIVRTYHEARFSGDVATAVAQLAAGFEFTSPLMRSDAAGHLASLPLFLQVVTGVDMISSLYGPDSATLVYDVHTSIPVGTQRTAEHFQLRGDQITAITLIFDATRWRALLPQT